MACESASGGAGGSSLVDLEDLITSKADAPATSVPRPPVVAARPQRRLDATDAIADTAEAVAAAVPGSQRVWMKTYGCAHNISDSEYMAGQLAAYGYGLVEDRELADVWVVNSCTVKDPSQSAFMNVVTKAKSSGRALVVAGCVPQGDEELKGLEDVSVVGTAQIDRVVEVVEETLKGNRVRLLEKKPLPALDLPKIRRNPLIEIVPLSTGCLGSCTYCKTRHARGALGSYKPEAIVSRVRSAVADGAVEVWLSSEDTGAYGRDIKTDIATLLRAVVAELPPHAMLRLGMTNPPFILEHLDALAELLAHPRVFAFLHVPVQSGSDTVLEAMRREYTVGEFMRVADFLKARVPGVTIATDVICGFPGETDDDFEETMDLVRRYRFAILNISQFYARPGTPAAKMKQLPSGVKKARSRAMTTLFESFTPYEQMKDRQFKVWVSTEIGSGGRHNVAHTKNYVKVLVEPRDDARIGQSCVVEVVECARFHVVGRVVDVPEASLPNGVGIDVGGKLLGGYGRERVVPLSAPLAYEVAGDGSSDRK